MSSATNISVTTIAEPHSLQNNSNGIGDSTFNDVDTSWSILIGNTVTNPELNLVSTPKKIGKPKGARDKKKRKKKCCVICRVSTCPGFNNRKYCINQNTIETANTLLAMI